MTYAPSVHEEAGPLIEPLPFDPKEYEARLRAVRSEMMKRGLDYFITFTPENIYYLTGHDTPGYYFYQATVVGMSGRPTNVLRRNETTNTLWRSWSRRVAVFDDFVTTPGANVPDKPAEATIALLAELGLEGRTVGLEHESWFLSAKRHAHLVAGITRLGGTPVEADGVVEGLRLIKSEAELQHMEAAARVVEAGMAIAIEVSHSGTTENEVAAATLSALARAGGEYAGLPPFVTSGPRTALCHSTWRGRQYRNGDLLNYEFPGVVNRYCAALFRTGMVGSVDVESQRRSDAIVECLASLIDAIRPGVTSHEVHMAGQNVLRRHGYGHMRGHRTGYSIGINYPPDWGEGQIMSIQEGDERVLLAGMTFHLIPTIYEWGRSIIGSSHTVLVTTTGCKPLTEFPEGIFTTDEGGAP